MFSLHLFILLLLLLLFSREVTSLNERVEFKINNKTTTTFFPNTNQQIHIIPVATTNIQLVCYPDNELASWHVSLTSVTTDGNTVILNRFTSNEVGVYECRFGDGQNVTPISISLQATGHGVYYISNGEYGTISTEETGIPKQLILKPDQLYTVICSGEAPEWRDNTYVGLCNGVRDVCQEVVSEVEAGLLFEESAAPFEYVCRVNIDLTHHSHNILFLPEDGVIPQNINISTEPYFPLIDGRITIRTLEVLITCSCEANPPVTPEDYTIVYNDGYSNSDMISVEAGFEDHTVEYMVICNVDNGISRDEAIQVTFNFSIEIPKISILSITTSMIEFTWGSVSQYLEEYVIYKTSYANGVNMEVNTYTNGNNSYSDSIDGLMACSEYYIQVLAYIEEIKEIDGGENGTILVTTESEDIRESPSNLITQSTGSRHVFITWTEVSTKSCTLYPINYTITYQSVSPDTSSSGSLVRHDIDTNKLDNGDLYAIITELEEYYEYDISVFASNWRGNGPVTRTMIRTKATVPSSTPESLQLIERTHLTWESPLIIHQNGIIKYYIVQIVNIYNRKDTENVTLETEDTFIDIKRDEEAVKLEISVRAVNQIGEGPEAILHITLNPYKDLPEIQDAVIILEVSLQALNNKEPNETSITPTQTSILVESLSRSLESVKQANESVNIDQSYFQDAIKAGSLLWETGILPNEGQSVSPSKNYADFLRIIDVLSILYTEFTYNSNVKRDTAPMESTFLESDNLHLTVMRLESGEIELGPLMLSVNSPRMLSHVQIDNPLLTPEDTGSSNDVIFSDKIHNFNLNTGNEDISATIMFNKSSGMNQECVFFNTTLNKWDTSGILTHVTPTGVNCETNHFTSFGVLVRPFDAGLTREQNLALSVVTYLLLSISLILLTIAIILYVITYKLTLRVEGNIVHFNYAIALFLATGTFIFGIQTATNSHPGCFVVTVLMHYTWLAVFAWSMCIAIMLFYKIFFVFSERRISWYLMFLGWGSPIVVVAITAGTANAYYIRIGEDHCWLSQERGLIWSFIGPILIILLVNMILLVMSTVKIFMSMSSFDKDRLRGLRVSLLSAAIMLPVLNTPWLLLLLFTFGVSAYSIIIEWMFVFLNASNGILFFFLLVLRNNEIRKSLRSGRFTKWMFTLRRGDKTDVSSQGRLSSKYSLKKQRTTDSYVESGMRKSLGDSMEIGDTRSPRSSVGDFPQPIPKQARTKEGFVALPTQDEITNEEPSYSNLSDKQTTGTEGTQPEPIYSQVHKKSKDPEYVNIPDLTTDQEPEPELKENTPVQDDSFVD